MHICVFLFYECVLIRYLLHARETQRKHLLCISSNFCSKEHNALFTQRAQSQAPGSLSQSLYQGPSWVGTDFYTESHARVLQISATANTRSNCKILLLCRVNSHKKLIVLLRFSGKVIILLKTGRKKKKKKHVSNQFFPEDNEVIILYVFYDGNQRNLLRIKYLKVL